ncbi:hypothetical protein ACWCOP_03120 [Maricaulaceae bacterium MS644]
MVCETIQPEDLTVQCADPFAELAPVCAGSPWRSFSLPEPRIFCSKLFRTLGPAGNEAAALRLGQWLTEGDYAALVMDYRGAVIAGDPAASETLADASAAAFPRGILVGYLGEGDSAPFTRLMTTLLRDRGVRAARASDFKTLHDALLKRLTPLNIPF